MATKIICHLCEKPIDNYQSEFNHLKINENHEIDICSNCIDKFRKWQQKTMIKLFPTSIAKKFIK